MKTGELVILWVGGLLSVVALIDGSAIDALEIKTFGAGLVAAQIVKILSSLLAIWIFCGLVWVTLYRRRRSNSTRDSQENEVIQR